MKATPGQEGGPQKMFPIEQVTSPSYAKQGMEFLSSAEQSDLYELHRRARLKRAERGRTDPSSWWSVQVGDVVRSPKFGDGQGVIHVSDKDRDRRFVALFDGVSISWGDVGPYEEIETLSKATEETRARAEQVWDEYTGRAEIRRLKAELGIE